MLPLDSNHVTLPKGHAMSATKACVEPTQQHEPRGCATEAVRVKTRITSNEKEERDFRRPSSSAAASASAPAPAPTSGSESAERRFCGTAILQVSDAAEQRLAKRRFRGTARVQDRGGAGQRLGGDSNLWNCKLRRRFYGLPLAPMYPHALMRPQASVHL